MARKLFEKQGIRTRSGPLASGVVFVVYSDSAGTVEADIAASSGGAAIVGSAVTVADIAGLGPAALQFWGPPAGTDTLYLRCPADTSLGVQEIEADEDERLDALEAGVAGIPATIFDAKGDLIAASAADTAARLGVGANDTLLTADSTTATGLKWAAGVSLSADNEWTGDQTFSAAALFSSGHPWVDVAAFVEAGDAGDDALAVQRAIDFAQTLVASSTKAPTVILTADEYHWETPVDWKSAPIVALTTMNQGCRVFWDGTAGETVLTKTTDAGGSSWGALENISFRNGTAQPGTWLDLTAGAVDFGLRLKELHFVGGDYAIDMANWYNAHWEHLRFDNQLQYAIRATPSSSQNLSSFVLDGFTYDHHPLVGAGKGFILIDNSDSAANLGVFALKNGRVEVNTAWASPQAVIHLKLADVSPTSRSLGLYLENVTYQDVISMASDVLVYQETAVTNLFPYLVFKNVRQSGLSAIVGGSVSTGNPPIPVQSAYGDLAVNVTTSNSGDVMAGQMRLLSGSGSTALGVRSGSESVDRFQITNAGAISWSGGTTLDTTLYRNAANVLKTDDLFVAALGAQLLPMTAPSAPASGATLYVDTADSKLKAIKADGDFIVLG